MLRRASKNKELAKYVEISRKDYNTRELNGNMVITQQEFLEKVLLPLQTKMDAVNYELVILIYLQSLIHLGIPISADLFDCWLSVKGRTQHIRQHILNTGGQKTVSALFYLYQTGLLRPDVEKSKRQLLQESSSSTILALSTLREANDYKTLLNYYNGKQNVDKRGESDA